MQSVTATGGIDPPGYRPLAVGLIREGGHQIIKGAGTGGGDGADRAERPGIGQYGCRWQGRGRGGMSGERSGE